MLRCFGRWALLLAVLLIARSAAAAEDEAEARELFKKAEVHYSLGEFEKALALYKEAYRIKQLPEFLFNIGQCHRHSGRCKEATFHFKLFLLKKPGAAERAQVEQLIRECEAKLQAEEATPADTPPPPAPQSEEQEPRHGLSRAWFWTGVGVTGALLVTATVTGILARTQNNEYHDPATSIDRRQELRDQGQALETTSWITLGLGGAAAAGTVVLFLLSRRGPPRDSAMTLAPTAAEGGGGVVLRGRF
jgi:tetratricopeptide (TPR) repeat protein